MLSLNGIFPPITTPFEKGEVSLHHLTENLKKWNLYELAGYVVLGSNGENVMLSEAESMAVVETAIEYTPKNKRIIIGAGRESSKHTVGFIKNVSQIGGDAALVVSPHYYKGQMNANAIEKYYLMVAEQSPLPIVIYNVPKFTGLEVPVDVIARLSKHPNIIGMKDSSGNISYQQSILSFGLKDFQLLTGTANTLMASLIMGAVGGILALANIAPKQCLQIYHIIKDGEFEKVRELQLKIIRLNQLTTGIYGIGGLKYALDKIGFYGGQPRPPLTLPDDQGKREIKTELKQVGLV